MTNEQPDDIPQCLLSSYKWDIERGHYQGSFQDWLNLQYLIYRAEWKSSLPVPSRKKWLKTLLEFERDTGKVGGGKDETT